VLLILGLVVIGLPIRAQASDTDLKKELESLKKEIEDLRKEKATSRPVGTGVVDKMVDNKYGPDAVVKTKQGKLTIGGLLQVWYYNIENDNLGYFGDRTPQVLSGGDTNEGKDNDSYALRRARVNFTMDIHENVQAYIQMDLANGFNGRPRFGSNLGTGLTHATNNVVAPNGNNDHNILLDAYIKVHGLLPHHDSKIGQFIPKVGMEGPQSSSALDFCERAMITQLTSNRDVGSELHGTWMDDRIQYWLGVYNTPNNWLGQSNQNQVDTNDLKSFLFSAQFRPVWKNETWGSLELGGSAQFSVSGESGRKYTAGNQVDGLNQPETDNIRYYGYAHYAPGGPVKGWWLKGEYAWIRGRVQTGEFTNGIMSISNTQDFPRAFDTSGWYVSTGYKLSDSIWADDLPWWLKPAEFAFRYETYGNIQVAELDPVFSDYRHDVFNTSIYTAGLNYYIKGNNAKIQVNYNWVNEPDADHDGTGAGGFRRVREVNNDNLVVNFQVAW
jgi:hypothetical protein